MSRSRDDESSPNRSAESAQSSRDFPSGRDLTNMMFQGRSFSGRERNCCFLNTGVQDTDVPRFATISAVSGLDFPDDGRAVALLDWDQDGDVDLWIANRSGPRLRMMENCTPTTNRSIALKLVGDGNITNRDAIGARVEITSGHQRWSKTLRAGEGFLAQSSKTMVFGLGNSSSIDRVTVSWPGGRPEDFSGLKPGHMYVLRQGEGKPGEERPFAPKLQRKQELVDPKPQSISSAAHVVLLEPLPMISVPYRSFAGEARELEFGKGRGLVVNLWASWCAPCRTELQDFAKRMNEIRSGQIDVLALSVDPLTDQGDETTADAVKLAESLSLKAGFATRDLVQTFQSLHDRLVPTHRQLPLPTSFLIDGQGRLIGISKGPLDVDRLLTEVRFSGKSRKERAVHAAIFPGSVVDHPRLDEVAQRAQVLTRYRLAQDLQQAGRMDDAERYYRDVVQRDPALAEAHNNLGTIYMAKGNAPGAANEFEQAIRSMPEYAEAHFNVGTVYEFQVKLKEAAAAYRRALSLRPDHAEARFNLGNVFARQGDWRNARTEYELALKIRPDHPGARQNLEIAKRQISK